MKIPFDIYADFETINAKLHGCEPNTNYYTERRTHHEVSGFTFMTVSPFFPMRKETYRGSDAGKVFLEKILKD